MIYNLTMPDAQAYFSPRSLTSKLVQGSSSTSFQDRMFHRPRRFTCVTSTVVGARGALCREPLSRLPSFPPRFGYRRNSISRKVAPCCHNITLVDCGR
jgi:hypothetical protein